MKGIIWCKDSYTRGNSILMKVVSQYTTMGIKTKHYVNGTSTGHWVEFDNGDSWYVHKANDNARGRRANIAYIERSIDMDTVKCIIYPTLTDFPFSAYRLFGEGDLRLTDEIPYPF